MVKLLFLCFRVTNSRLKNKTFHFELLTRWLNFSSLSIDEHKVDKWKRILKCYSLNLRELLEIDITLRFLRTSSSIISLGCPDMLKCSQILELSNCLYWYDILNSCKYLKSETHLPNAQVNKASSVNKEIVKTCLIEEMVRKNLS